MYRTQAAFSLWFVIFSLVGKAVILGILVTAPVGPVGALVIRRTLKSGMLMGVFTGLGAALADSAFAFLAVLGVSWIEELIKQYEGQIALVGGVALLVMGSVSLSKNLREHRASKKPDPIDELSPELAESEQRFHRSSGHWVSKLFRGAAGSLVITLTNPVTIVGFAGAFTVFGFGGAELFDLNVHAYRGLIVAGVFVGAMTWWSGLSLLVFWMSGRLSKSSIFMVHFLTSGVILASGLLCLGRALTKIN